MGTYDTPTQDCPYCESEMEADFVDVGIGMQQCGPYHCHACGASEIGPEISDWYYKDRDGDVIVLPGKKKYFSWAGKKLRCGFETVLIPGHPFTDKELETGYYQGKISPYANTVGGVLVDHVQAKQMYDRGLLDDKKL